MGEIHVHVHGCGGMLNAVPTVKHGYWPPEAFHPDPVEGNMPVIGERLYVGKLLIIHKISPEKVRVKLRYSG
jgi:hypothetical protein